MNYEMSYHQFLEKMLEGLKKELGSGYCLQVDQLICNNDRVVDALTILKEGENVSPAIHLDRCYGEYEQGAAVEDLCRNIVSGYRNSALGGSMDTDFLRDWDRVRGRLVCRLVGRSRNKRRLNEVVYTPFLDMAVIYYYLFQSEENLSISTAVKRSMTKGWGVGPEQIDRAAAANTRALNPPCFMGLDQMMDHMLHTDLRTESSPLCVLTNRERMNGAYWIRDREVMDGIAGQIGDGFLVLPSSVHECMILPADVSMDIAGLKDMVTEINRTEVDPGEVLTDNVYRYSREGGLREAMAE